MNFHISFCEIVLLSFVWEGSRDLFNVIFLWIMMCFIKDTILWDFYKKKKKNLINTERLWNIGKLSLLNEKLTLLTDQNS